MQLRSNADKAKRLAVFPNLTPGQYQKAVTNAARRCGLGNLKLTPHRFRHGGPSTDVHHNYIDLEGIAKRGQWGAGSLGVKRYETHAHLLKVFNEMSDDQRRKGDSLVKTIGKALMKATLKQQG